MHSIKKIFSRLITFFSLAFLYPCIYRMNAGKPVDKNKIIFLNVRGNDLSNNFTLLYKTLEDKKKFTVVIHNLFTGSCSRTEYIKRCAAYIKDLATAKYVFLDEATHITGKIDIRSETSVIQLWHGCGAFKKFGYSTATAAFGATAATMERFPPNKNYSLVTVSSEEVIPHFEEAMGYSDKKDVVKATGVSRTDVFFDEEFIKNAYSKLYSVFPNAKDKKVILYAPTFRGNVETAISPDRLNFEKMSEKLSDEYVLILKYHHIVKSAPKITDEAEGFVADLTEKMNISELLCVSDICISDYSSLVFEYSLFGKPMIFFAYDLEDYFESRGFYYNYEDFTPGPVFKTTDDVIDYILNIEKRFDRDEVTAFRNKFMSACDGKATERIISALFDDK